VEEVTVREGRAGKGCGDGQRERKGKWISHAAGDTRVAASNTLNP
jgi:hypothetical protein